MKSWPMWERMWDPDDWVHVAFIVVPIFMSFSVTFAVCTVASYATHYATMGSHIEEREHGTE